MFFSLRELMIETGARGFGLVAMEDIKEGQFVIDYRGEVSLRRQSTQRQADVIR